MKPTVMGGRTPSAVVTAPPPASITIPEAPPTTALQPFVGSKIVIAESQVPEAQKRLDTLDIATIPQTGIVQLGYEAEQGLNNTLNGFLARINKNDSAPIFALFVRLKKGVTEADLPGVLKQIEQAKPSFLTRVFSRKGQAELLQQVLDGLKQVLTGKTTNLLDEMTRLEAELKTSITTLSGEMVNIDKLKEDYSTHLADFALSAAVAEAFVKKAEAYVAQRTQELAGDTSNEARNEIQDLDNKLNLLRSRALALEGTYTRLPADQEVIRQIENAGIATLNETMTTAASRFASIKMTLITANSALTVRATQNLSDASRQLDEDLLKARGAVVRQTAVAAASAPGANRLAQAEQIMRIVTETNELYKLVETATNESNQKMAQAKQSFEQSRTIMQQMGR